jgi:SPP1 family predicted phage head-tail adaptor
MGIIRPGDLDREITFQRKQAAPTSAPVPGGPTNPNFMKAGKEAWTDVATVRAEVQEMLPSRGERLVEGMSIAQRPARIRIWYRDDITADMRIIYGTRTMEIMADPIELGRRNGLELMAQDFSTAGNAA